MEPIVISDDEEDDDVSDEAVEVPPFVPPPKQEATPPSAATEPKEPPGAEISFSNLTKEACRQLKEAFVKWLQCSEVLPALSLSQPEEVRVSGKFRLECTEKETPRVVFLPTRRAILTEQQIKSPATFNETIDKMFEVPLYERSSARLPGEDRSSGRMPIIQRMQCYNCGSYHHQIRSCRRPPQRQHFDRPRTSDFGRGRGRGTPSEGRLREETGKRSSQQLPPGNGTGTAFKKLRMEKGFILGSEATSGSANNKTKENGIPRVKIETDSDSDVNAEGLEDGEVIESRPSKVQKQPNASQAPPPEPIKIKSFPPEAPMVVPEVVMEEEDEDEIEEGEIVETKVKEPIVQPPPRTSIIVPPPWPPPAAGSFVPHPLEGLSFPTLYPPPPPPPPPPQQQTMAFDPSFVHTGMHELSTVTVNPHHLMPPSHYHPAPCPQDPYFLPPPPPPEAVHPTPAGFPIAAPMHYDSTLTPRPAVQFTPQPPAIVKGSTPGIFPITPATIPSQAVHHPSADIVFVDHQGKVIIIKQPQQQSL